MRWSTLVLSVTLFYSLSFVNAIPHDADEKRYWLHERQDSVGSSSVAASPSKNPQVESSSAASPSSRSDTPAASSAVSLSSSSSTPVQSPTSQASSELSSPSTSTSSGSTSSPLPSTSTTTNIVTRTSSTSSSTTANRPDTQVTTSYRHFSSTVDIPGGTSSTDGSSETASGSTSFLKNKAAMGSAFAIVGLVGAALISGAIFFSIKKVRQRREEEDFETYFEKAPASHGNSASNRDIGGGNDYGLGPSATDLTAPTNGQTYMSRDVHYGSTGQYPNQFANHGGLEYPPNRSSVVERPVSYAPGTAYAAAMSQRGQYHYQGQVEDPNTVPNHPFADPDNRRY